jgi:hypothetical protein
MLGSFWNTRKEDLTPKAPTHSNPNRERNPFEASLGTGSSAPASSLSSSLSSSTTGRNSRKNSTASASSSSLRDFGAANGNGNNGNLSSNSSSTTSLSGITALSSSSGSSHHLASGHSHHGIPAGLRTPTLQKSFVLPEVISSVTATGSHVTNPSTKTATAALHQSPMYPNNSNNNASSGRNTPTRTVHQPPPSGPYPNPKDHTAGGNGIGASPKSRQTHQHHQPQQPEFKLGQPPDSKSSPTKKNGDSAAAGSNEADETASSLALLNQSFTSDVNSDNTQSNNSTSTTTNQSTALSQSTRKRDQHGPSTLRGKLTVKIIEARNLVTPEANVRPYVVATFEQNEFVSREAINEHEEEATGQPVSPRTSSHLRSSQRAPEKSTNGAKEGAQEVDNMDVSTASAYHPVWKHEVAL